jgi:hypothetical protein
MTVTYDLRIDETAFDRETEKAVLIHVETQTINKRRPVWIPRSLITWVDHGPNYKKTVAVPFWFAKQNYLLK